ncbi:MAG: hypothetical protein ABI282_06415 [Candidatus Baltobacteraceae bacterium]
MPRTLHANNSALTILGVVFLAGAALFALGSWFARKTPASVGSPHGSPRATWVERVTESSEPLGIDARMDLIERLAIVGQPWCSEALQAALDEERDPAVRDAAQRALSTVLR